MKFTLSWLKEYLDTNESLADIAHHLTALGIEVEGIEDPTAALAPFLIAHVKKVIPHPNADRLRICSVDPTGTTPDDKLLQVVCGAPNVYAGMKTVFALSGTRIPESGIILKPSEIRGVASQGMLCSAYELALGADGDGIIDLPSDAPVGLPYARTYNLDDPVLDISITPNRSDCFGVYGVARDLAAAGVGKLKNLHHPKIEHTFESPIHVKNHDEQACPIFMGRVIRNVKNTESPEWLKKKLLAIGLNPISALVDITNYINYDLGRPLHVFDAKKINGKLHVRFAKNGEKLEALNDKEYNLTSEVLIIADDQAPLSAAGIMGGRPSGVTIETTDVFLECAHFTPNIISKGGRALNIHSDSRTRFERGVDPQSVSFGLDMATKMILEICGGEASHAVQSGHGISNQKHIKLHPERFTALTGVKLTQREMKNILHKLGFKDFPESKEDNCIDVISPSWRFDIQIEEDLIEEILRIYGLDHLPEVPLPQTSSISLSPVPVEERNLQHLRKFLSGQGLMETISYSFASEEFCNHFVKVEDEFKLSNPISSDLSVMRPSLFIHLLGALRRNMDRSLNDVHLFEIGNIFGSKYNNKQTQMLAGVLHGSLMGLNPHSKSIPSTVYDAKGYVLSCFEILGMGESAVQIQKGAPHYYHPGQSATLYQGPKKILGHFGKIHPKTAKFMDVPEDTIIFELSLSEDLLERQKAPKAYAPSDLQPVYRDFAFVVDKTIDAEKLIQAIKKVDKTLIHEVILFDVYMGKGLEDHQKSLALRVKIEPQSATLTDADLQALSEKIIGATAQSAGATLR